MNPTFSETQGFNKWWHYMLAALPMSFFIVSFLGVQFDIMSTKNNEKEPLVFISMILIAVGFFIWFRFLKLNTTIHQSGIEVNFKWIPFCKRKISWADIQSIEIIEYSPLYDYGGWGVRYSMSGKGWCYNVSGKMGIKLTLNNGKPFLIGTQKPEEAQTIINHYFKK